MTVGDVLLWVLSGSKFIYCIPAKNEMITPRYPENKRHQHFMFALGIYIKLFHLKCYTCKFALIAITRHLMRKAKIDMSKVHG
jgi:hypothetical protein